MVIYCVVLCSCSLRLALRDIPDDLLRKRPHIVLEEEYLMLHHFLSLTNVFKRERFLMLCRKNQK